MGSSSRAGILWVTRDGTAPHPYLVESCRRAGAEVRELRWAEEQDGRRPMGRFVARSIDLFIANNAPARAYLVDTLKVPGSRIVTGWWLAGLPPELPGKVPSAAPVPEGTPLFLCVGRLIAPKGIDLLLEAGAVHRRQVGPCMLWVLGDGPERAALGHLARRLGIEDSVAFLGTVDPAGLKGALEACDALVFPTLQDLVGRVVVEALTVGVPVVVSPMTGAAGTIVKD